MSDPEVRFVMKTRQGNEVPVRSGPSVSEYTAGQRRALEEYVLPGADLRRRPCLDYNCHGLTFAGKMGWVADQPPPQLIALPLEFARPPVDTDADVLAMLKGNGYRRVHRIPNLEIDPLPERSQVEIGDIVLYVHVGRPEGQRIYHSGMVVAVEESKQQPGSIADITVLSKIGRGGEYLHSYRTVPRAYPKTVDIWSDRRNSE